jgi:hypothetical protein
MQGYYTFLALDIANERVREAEQHRQARRGQHNSGSRLARLLRDLAGNLATTFSGAPDEAKRPA